MATYNAFDPGNTFDPFGSFDPFENQMEQYQTPDFSAAPGEEDEDENYFAHLIPEMNLDTDEWRDQNEEIKDSMEAFEAHGETRPDDNIWGEKGDWKSRLKSEGARNSMLYLSQVLGAIQSGNTGAGMANAAGQLHARNEASRKKLQVDWQVENERLRKELLADKDRAGYLLQTAATEDAIAAAQKQAELFEQQGMWASKVIGNSIDKLGEVKELTPEMKSEYQKAFASMYVNDPKQFNQVMGAIGATMPRGMSEDVMAASYLLQAQQEQVMETTRLVVLAQVGENWSASVANEIRIAYEAGDGSAVSAAAFIEAHKTSEGANQWAAEIRKEQARRDEILFNAEDLHRNLRIRAMYDETGRKVDANIFVPHAESEVRTAAREDWGAFASHVGDLAGIEVLPENLQTYEGAETVRFKLAPLDKSEKADMYAAAVAANEQGLDKFIEYGLQGSTGAIMDDPSGAWELQDDEELEHNRERIAEAAVTASEMGLSPQDVIFSMAYDQRFQESVDATVTLTRMVMGGHAQVPNPSQGIPVPPIFMGQIGWMYGTGPTPSNNTGAGMTESQTRAAKLHGQLWERLKNVTDPMTSSSLIDNGVGLDPGQPGSSAAQSIYETGVSVGAWQWASRDEKDNIPTPQTDEQAQSLIGYVAAMGSFSQTSGIPSQYLLGEGLIKWIATTYGDGIEGESAVTQAELTSAILNNYKTDNVFLWEYFKTLELVN